MYRIGIDLGGTNIAAGVVDESQHIVAEVSLPTGAERPAEAVVADICRAAEKAMEKAGITAAHCASVGIGSPGTCDSANGVVVRAYNLGWFNVPVCSMVTARLGLPCHLSNDANCAALAETVAGSEEAFVALMNRKAGELGMKHTHFANCTGLTSPEHYSSAADLAVLLQAALNNETFRTVFTTGQYTSSVTAQHPKGLYMASTLLSRLDGGEVTGGQIQGGKTGYTDAAGLCLASLAVVNGKEYILVTLGAPGNHATEQTNIMDAVQVYRRLEKKK